jgi:hypothetical protein
MPRKRKYLVDPKRGIVELEVPINPKDPKYKNMMRSKPKRTLHKKGGMIKNKNDNKR